MNILGVMALVLVFIVDVVLIVVSIIWLSGGFDKKILKVGRKVAVRRFMIDKNCDELKIGKIVATRPRVEGAYWELLYAVKFDDGKIRFFREDEIFTGWREK